MSYGWKRKGIILCKIKYIYVCNQNNGVGKLRSSYDHKYGLKLTIEIIVIEYQLPRNFI